VFPPPPPFFPSLYVCPQLLLNLYSRTNVVFSLPLYQPCR
jgi:hypothetical protein